ncbi:MAG: phosphonate C-P lyase system protein PhnG [Cyanobacteria bacterium J06614_10]
MDDLTARKRWMATLAKAPLQELEALVGQLEHLPDYRFLRSPETGLTMVRGRAGGVGEVFNLGEMTLTRCVVQLSSEPMASVMASEETITGFGYVGGRSHRHAELAALCDGLLQHSDWQARVQSAVIEPLTVMAQRRREQQQQQTAATKVDFFTMLRGQ